MLNTSCTPFVYIIIISIAAGIIKDKFTLSTMYTTYRLLTLVNALYDMATRYHIMCTVQLPVQAIGNVSELC